MELLLQLIVLALVVVDLLERVRLHEGDLLHDFFSELCKLSLGLVLGVLVEEVAVLAEDHLLEEVRVVFLLNRIIDQERVLLQVGGVTQKVLE